MKFIADFHIHSRHSISTSKDMEIPAISEYAKRKGISLVGSGDFTHPVWVTKLEKYLKPAANGLYSYNGVNFILTAEVSNIFYVKERAKKIHLLIFAPSLEAVHKLNKKLINHGKLLSDGRPIIHLSAKDLLKMILDICPDCFLVPAHVWTPHFSVFGANSGFDSIEECFGDLARYIYALETGLSSDPAMNWQWSALDKYALISNSDAHSPIKLGREANIFDTEIDYYKIIDAIKNSSRTEKTGAVPSSGRMLATIEFFPQEGKYHWDGHRNCNISFSAEDTIRHKNICPVCQRPLTIGVLHRVSQLGDRPKGVLPPRTIPFYNLIPLTEIMAQAWGKQDNSSYIINEYFRLTRTIGTEFEILMDISTEDLYRKLPRDLAGAIQKVREGKVTITPGYDGVYGKIKIPKEEEIETTQQMQLF